ncbi:MAG: TauD/TfdA family dioxygenase [Chitinophagales bacterium]|nr:TauD/TfdA family dioxygenase [Chitinophagales bacterium]MDW8419785.1 TauD/TfdA family dioxygenase [Chitinophagales bacterium]
MPHPSALPYILTPETGASKSSLLHYIHEHNNSIREALLRHGAILFRGFDLPNPKDFEDVALCIDPRLRNDYYGTSPRNIVPGTRFVYTASELPGYYPIPQHCEMSYVVHPPIHIFFYCHVQPKYGGETPLCDFRKVYAQLNPDIRKEFEEKGVLTVRNYSGLNKNRRFNLFELKRWDEIFHTTDRAEVERQCREQQIQWEWLPDGRLRLLHRTPAVLAHPVTKEKAWYNHLQVFHPYGAKVEYEYIHRRQKRLHTFFWKNFLSLLVYLKQMTTSPTDHSMNVLFGDGSPVPNEYVRHIQDVIWSNMVIIPWQRCDVLAIDNSSTAHGRLPYEGEREILACWSA